MKQADIVKNGLHFAVASDGYICRELADLPQAFEAKWTPKQVEDAIRRVQDTVVSNSSFDVRGEERDNMSPAELLARGAEIMQEIIAGLKTDGLSLFEQFLFWCSDDWWYYNPVARTKCRLDVDAIGRPTVDAMKTLLIPVLPESIRQVVRNMDLISVAVGFGHFAFLFNDELGNYIRRIVTDTRLYELRDVGGYPYIDITPDGRPITRSCCFRGGERAFFDGLHLMAHDKFQTCAPRTVMVDGGYKFNSTRCSVVNGQLFDLIDVDDRVAHSTGAIFFPGGSQVSWSKQQAVDSINMAAESGARLRCVDGKVLLDGQELKPLGRFAPSVTTLLDNGFTLYDWSVFHETKEPRYTSVMIVDDKQEWVQAVYAELLNVVPHLEICLTSSAEEALASILRSAPEVVLLDMHLTDDERFEGLWIANQLAAEGFKGKLFITSSYSREALEAMRKLIRCPVEIPGKDIQAVRELLYL